MPSLISRRARHILFKKSGHKAVNRAGKRLQRAATAVWRNGAAHRARLKVAEGTACVCRLWEMHETHRIYSGDTKNAGPCNEADVTDLSDRVAHGNPQNYTQSWGSPNHALIILNLQLIRDAHAAIHANSASYTRVSL